ncbi:hypothetical protein LP420_17775 [Massilia sp. B-10]|nr:hypothetical protein LP420_17775 [Massilia sp. B-10]
MLSLATMLGLGGALLACLRRRFVAPLLLAKLRLLAGDRVRHAGVPLARHWVTMELHSHEALILLACIASSSR